MYSYTDRLRTVKLHIKLGKRLNATIRQLGYPTKNALKGWYREGLGIEVDFPLPAERVIRSLNQIIESRGKPFAIQVDNGPEYVSGKLMEWGETQGIAFSYIQPGKPQQNAYVERYNRTVRHE